MSQPDRDALKLIFRDGAHYSAGQVFMLLAVQHRRKGDMPVLLDGQAARNLMERNLDFLSDQSTVHHTEGD